VNLIKAIGEYKLGHYKNARHFNTMLLSTEPENQQGLELEREINEKVR
jgi:Fis1 C-terminal tetratricopeptide repeat